MIMRNNYKLYSILVVLIFPIIVPVSVRAECTCDSSDTEDRNKAEALRYKLVAIASILVAGAVGVCIPLLGRIVRALHPENDVFFVIKAFAAGVILATGFIHVLPDAFESLTSPCLGGVWGDFPFSGFVAMTAAIGVMMVDTVTTSYFKRSHVDHKVQSLNGHGNGDVEKLQQEQSSGTLHVHTHASHGHAHGSTSSENFDSSHDHLRHKIISQVLELGIVVHSVIIGISLGASMSPKTIKPLVAALTFHQFFEGMGLGSCISQAKFKARTIAIMSIFFSLTAPVGITIGFGISNIYDESSPTALIVEGIFNSASAGILIYMALVDLLAADFMNSRIQNNVKLHLGAYLSLLFGAGFMSLLAKWA